MITQHPFLTNPTSIIILTLQKRFLFRYINSNFIKPKRWGEVLNGAFAFSKDEMDSSKRY